MSDWEPVRNRKKEKRVQRLEEKIKWRKLIEDYPHIVTPGRSKMLSRKLNIAKLDQRFKEESWVELQMDGWRFIRVIKPDEQYTLEVGNQMIMPLNNGYGDVVLFQLKVEEDDTDQDDK